MTLQRQDQSSLLYEYTKYISREVKEKQGGVHEMENFFQVKKLVGFNTDIANRGDFTQ